MTLSGFGTVLFVPPVNLPVLALIGLIWNRRASRLLALVAMAGLVLLAMPICSDTLLHALGDGGSSANGTAGAGAIVVLGADVAHDPASPHSGAPGPLTLERLRAGAALARRTGLPLLVSGGIVDRDLAPVAEIMAKSLASDFLIPPAWVEAQSATTWENAANSARILRLHGITTVLVVTHAWHERRALIAFEHTGLAAIPSPLRQNSGWNVGLASLVPKASGWMTSYYALHEWIGCLWYWLRARQTDG